MRLDPAALDSLAALALGFAFAGALATAFEMVSPDRASFRLLERGGLPALACVPMLVFSAPFIIVRNTIRGRRIERRPFHFVMLSTAVAGLWSLMSGRLVLDLALRIAHA